MQIRIYYEDTDCGGIVYHSQYINFCERARSERFFSRGLMPGGEREGFVVKKLNADFKASAKLGDLLEVKSKLLWMKNSSFAIKQEIFRKQQLLFSAEVTLAYLKDAGLARIDEGLKARIRDLF